MSPARWKSIWNHCYQSAADWDLHSLHLVYVNYQHHIVISSCFFFSAGNTQKETMALILTSTFPVIPPFPLGAGENVSSASSRAAV